MAFLTLGLFLLSFCHFSFLSERIMKLLFNVLFVAPISVKKSFKYRRDLFKAQPQSYKSRNLAKRQVSQSRSVSMKAIDILITCKISSAITAQLL